MASSERRSFLHYANIIVISLGILLMLISMMPGLTWAEFDRTSGIGPADYRLKVNFDAVGFDYNINISAGEGGGIMGGLGGSKPIEDEKSYPEVRGEFLDNVGLLYDSYREKSFQYELKMKAPPADSGIEWDDAGNPGAYLNVTMESDLIPWWPVSGSRTLDVKIEMINIDLLDQVSDEEKGTLSIHVSRVVLKAKVGYNKGTGEYEGGEKELYSKDVNFRMTGIGQSDSISFDLEYPEGEDAIGLFAEIEGNMTDFWGRPELSPLPGKANPINIYPLSTGKLMQGIGIPLALPIMAVSALLGLMFIIRSVRKNRNHLGLIAPASVLSILAPLWFFIGMNAAVDLLGERLTGADEGLSWGVGVFLSFGGALLLTSALVITIIIKIKMKNDRNSSQPLPTFRRMESSVPEPRKEAPSQGTGTFKRVEGTSEKDSGISAPPGPPAV
ncbi:MAG: hypothetical protein U9R75_12140 [Candidatus Thermoplasmatota archaeon]|nr:hypothetical protein [Candidatus Thermoplasmatota archaeon]